MSNLNSILKIMMDLEILSQHKITSIIINIEIYYIFFGHVDWIREV
jgi:hypothetical protein